MDLRALKPSKRGLATREEAQLGDGLPIDVPRDLLADPVRQVHHQRRLVEGRARLVEEPQALSVSRCLSAPLKLN